MREEQSDFNTIFVYCCLFIYLFIGGNSVRRCSQKSKFISGSPEKGMFYIVN